MNVAGTTRWCLHLGVYSIVQGACTVDMIASFGDVCPPLVDRDGTSLADCCEVEVAFSRTAVSLAVAVGQVYVVLHGTACCGWLVTSETSSSGLVPRLTF